jgi:hypothetical protein
VSWADIILNLSLEIAVKHTFSFMSSFQLVQHQLSFKLAQGQKLGLFIYLRLRLMLFEFKVKETIVVFGYIYLRVGHHESLLASVVG